MPAVFSITYADALRETLQLTRPSPRRVKALQLFFRVKIGWMKLEWIRAYLKDMELSIEITWVLEHTAQVAQQARLYLARYQRAQRAVDKLRPWIIRNFARFERAVFRARLWRGSFRG